MIKDLLQGKPLKHPLHPLLVHFPIGLFLLSFLFDLASWIVDEEGWLVRGAFYTMAFGVIGGLLASIPGFVDYSDIRGDHPAKKTATYHMLLNLLAIGMYAVNVGLRYGDWEVSRTPVVPLILSLIAVGIINFSGYLGGTMIYDDGIAVGRHRRRTPMPPDTIRPTAAGEQDGFIPVADADRLQEGQTLRVEVNGHVMAVVKLDGQVYAFQEFCTHRYGPLSEGQFHDGQVVCPWHRSCFDVRTGKATAGPAKVDLKTYAVQIRDGKILVKI